MESISVMKSRTTLILFAIVAVAVLSLALFSRFSGTKPTVSTEKGQAFPQVRSFDPSTARPGSLVFEKAFGFTGKQSFRSREARPQGYLITADNPLVLIVPAKTSVLGLLVDARASKTGLEVPHLFSPHYREGVNLKPELTDAESPTLEVCWDEQKADDFKVSTLYWRPLYCRIDGKDKDHRLEIRLSQPSNSQADYSVVVRKVSVFSQNSEDSNEKGRIGIPEAAMRARGLDRKIILLGLDGLTWDILDPLIEKGVMPNFKRLIESGVRTKMLDEPPLDSVKIWTTIATGRHPASHGIDQRVFRDPEKNNDVLPVNSTLRKTKAMWNIFGDMGKTVGIVNWFVTWPTEAVNGFIVSDWSKFTVDNVIYPEFLGVGRENHIPSEADLQRDRSALAKKVKTLRNLAAEGSYPARNRLEELEFAALLERAEEVYFNDSYLRNYGIDLYRRSRPDLFALYFHGTDAMSHAFYKFRYTQSGADISEEQVNSCGDPIEDVYRFHDQTLGKLMETAAPDTVWAIMSDHGFQAQPVKFERIYSYGMDPILNALGFLKYHKGKDIDWSQTACYSSKQIAWNPVTWLRLNVKGRESEGIVPESKFQKERDRIVADLQSIVFKSSKDPVFLVEPVDDPKRPHDIRVQILMRKDCFARTILVAGQEVDPADIFNIIPCSGTHHVEGILVLAGPGVRQGERISQARTVDVLPTLLQLAGLPIAEDMDGSLLEDALETEYLHRVPMRSIPSYEPFGKTRSQSKALRESEKTAVSESQDQIIDQLRGLGYL